MVSADNTALEGLDDAQLLAATTLSGPVRIVAGAGAGKTRTITRRIAHAVALGAWNPARTLAVTFSVKAAAEMRSRLSSLGVDGVTAATFHSEALRQVRRVWPMVTEADFPHLTGRARDHVAAALRRAAPGIDGGPTFLRDVQGEIDWAKVSLVAPDDYRRVVAATSRTPPAGLDAERFAAVYRAYEDEKSAHGEIDFQDILLLACHLLEAFPEAAAAMRRDVRWLTVDEYQDVSPLQHRLLELWLDGGRDVCVVGDPAQTIYSFAGASSYDLLSFGAEFAPLAADVDLAVDYRSTPQIVRCANRVLAASPRRGDYLRLTSGRQDGTRIDRTVYDSDADEAHGVARRIARAVAGGRDAGDFAVLTRINAQQPAICAALRQESVRYRVRGDAAVGQVLPDDGAARRAMLDQLANGTGGGAVTVSTIHAAKGLEFPHVFLVGCSEGLLPYGSPSDAEALEEERRLLYVGVTRAGDSLHLSYARTKDGAGSVARRPSRFLV